MSKLKLPPISPLIGSTLYTFIRVLVHRKVRPSRWLHIALSSLIIILIFPFRIIDFIYFRHRLKKQKAKYPPLFIIGHWRSGTTFLHNILSKIRGTGYVTTYQSVFPNHLKSKPLLGIFMRTIMPERRPGDNIEMNIDYPQEEEYALSNLTPHSFYHFFYYPKDYKTFYKKEVRFQNLSPKVISCWKRKYTHLVEKACINTGGEIPLLKNPVNTSRINTLLQLYPEARFVHIVRNPVAVYCSTRKFFSAVIPTLSFQDITTEDISNMIFWLYENLMKDYLKEKTRIPEEQFYEIRYETLLAHPAREIEKLCSKLHIKLSASDKTHITTYLETQKSHKTDHYRLSQKELDTILNRWGFAMKMWNYQVPDNIKIVD